MKRRPPQPQQRRPNFGPTVDSFIPSFDVMKRAKDLQEKKEEKPKQPELPDEDVIYDHD